MATSIKQIRIFISSPSDVSEERMAALKVIEELNRTFCEHQGLLLFPLTWEHNTYPSVGDYSQDVINQQIGNYDIFVGIMANRFGSPTQKAESGTEEEFNIAYENRRNRHIMFFFNNRPVNPYSLDLEQLAKVKSFKDKLSKQGVLYKEFSADFERIFRDCLMLCLNDNFIKKSDSKEDNRTLKISQEIVFTEYHRRMYNKYSVVNTLVFHNRQRLLKDIYVTQTLVSEHNPMSRIQINPLPVPLIKQFKKVLITDTAGMGKSTILKRMFIEIIDKKEYIKELGNPIYIELNRLNKDRTILMELHEELSSYSESQEIDKYLLLKEIQMGGFIFFLDGYDEISISDRKEVSKDIQSFINRTDKNNYFILTSRPESNLTSFGDFMSFKIDALSKDDAYELLRKYDLGEKKELSQKLITLLDSGDYKAIDDFLKNPLLVSLLYKAFDFERWIPLRKHIFYGQVYDAFFQVHDFSKDINARKKNSGLGYDDFDRVLRFVGYECVTRIGLQFDKDTIIKSISRAKAFCANLDFEEYAFLKDLLTTVPLFTKDGIEFKWVHISMMEYFAARFIYLDTKKKQEEILSTIYNSKHIYKFINMLDLYCDIDFMGFSNNIIRPFCEEFLEYRKEQIFMDTDIDAKTIEERIGVSFGNTRAFLVCNSTTEKNDVLNIFKRYFDSLPIIELSVFSYDGEDNLYKEKSVRRYWGCSALTRVWFFVDLLERKKPELFKNKENIYQDGTLIPKRQYQDILKIICEFESSNEGVYELSVRTGHNNNYLYSEVNTLFPRTKFIDYKKCEKLISEIKELIKLENNFLIY